MRRDALFDELADGPRDSMALAAALDLPLAGAERLMRGAAALGSGRASSALHGRWDGKGAALLGNRGVAAWSHITSCSTPTSPIRSRCCGVVAAAGPLSAYWHYAERPEAATRRAVAAYSALMAASQPLVAQQVIDAYPFHRHRRLLDVGGGEGRVPVRGGRIACRDSTLWLFDLPAVVDASASASRARRHAARIAFHGGDFLPTRCPAGPTWSRSVRVLHDHDDAPALALLRAVHARAARRTADCCMAEPMAQRQAQSRWAMPISASTCWPWAPAGRAAPDEYRAMLRRGGLPFVARPADRSCR